MENIKEDYLISTIFNKLITREELLLKKYDEYLLKIKDSEEFGMLKEFVQTSQEHIKVMRKKMLKLNIK